MNLKLENRNGDENMIHMDTIDSFVNNNDPSYNQELYRPTSLTNLYENSKDITPFFEDLIQNLWLLFQWFDEY